MFYLLLLKLLSNGTEPIIQFKYSYKNWFVDIYIYIIQSLPIQVKILLYFNVNLSYFWYLLFVNYRDYEFNRLIVFFMDL